MTRERRQGGFIMMNYINGWMDRGMMGGENWIWPVIGVLVVVLLVVLISKVSNR